MVFLSQLQQYLDNYLYFDKSLDVAKIDPHMANGLMVRGKDEIKRIGFSVSASISLFEKAREVECDAIVVHHAFNLPSTNCYDKIFQDRIWYLLKNDISLFGYHFLLDTHPEVGNNVQIIKTLGAKPKETYLHHGIPWGWLGEFDKKVNFKGLVSKFKPFMSKKNTVYHFGSNEIKRVVVVSGKGAPNPSDMQFLINQEIDLYITGEVHEWNRELFAEAAINFIAAGHYSTEVFGVKALMDRVIKQFPQLTTEWIQVYNKV